MSTRAHVVTILAMVSVMTTSCSCTPAVPALTTPFETVEQPRDLCGTALETELRARRLRLPACGEAVEMSFVRARAGAHDVVVVAYDDVTPTYDDGPTARGACVVIDGAPYGRTCPPPTEQDVETFDESEVELSLGDMLGAAPPPSPADSRAILRAAILARAETTHVAWDAAGREARSATWGPMRELVLAIPVGMRDRPSGIGVRAFSATQDLIRSYWRANIVRYDAWLDADGRIHEHVESLVDAQSSPDRHEPPWESGSPP